MWPYRAAYREWVFALNRLGRSKEAISLACRVIRYRPISPATYTETVAETLRGLPDNLYELTRDAFVETVKGLRHDLDASWTPDIRLAEALGTLGDRGEAASLLYHLELFVPWKDRLGWMTRSASDYSRWGRAWLEADHAGNAARKFKMALKADPESLSAWQGLGTAHALSGDLGRSDNAFETMLRLNPERPQTYVEWAEARRAAADYAGAAALYQKAWDAGHTRPAVALARTEALIRSGQADEAVRRVREADRMEGSEGRFAKEVAQSLMMAGRWDEAVSELIRALERSPRSNSTHRLAGLCYLGLREGDKAAQHFSTAIRRKNQDPLLPVYAFLANARAGKAPADAPDLTNHLKEIRHDYWPTPVYRFCASEISAEELLARAARRTAPRERAARLATAHQVIGEVALLADDQDRARGHFESCIAQEQFSSPGHLLAARLLSHWPPASGAGPEESP